MAKVLCYSPYTMWALHGQWEQTVLHSLRLRGAEVRYVLCDGQFTDCDLFWQATNPRHPLACSQCQARSTGLAASMGMEWEWLGRYITVEERRTARAWADSLADTELRDAVYGDWRVGDWVAGSVHTHFRRSALDPTDSQIAAGLRSYAFSGLVACFGISRLLDDFDPDTLFLFNGRQSSTRVALEIAKARGVRVVCHERGRRKESLGLFENESCASLVPVRQMWDDWGQVPLTRAELETTAQALEDREHGRNFGWKSYNPPPQAPEDLRAALRLSPDRPTWAVFTSSDDEAIAEADWQGAFDRQLDWLERSLAWAEAHPELDLVIRVHPNTGGAKATGSNLAALAELERLAQRLPANVRMVMPDDVVSSYTLMDLAQAGLVYHSTVALELACKGKPVIVAAGNLVAGLPFVRMVDEAAGYEALLDSVAAEPADAAEIRRGALRFAHAYYFRRDVPFPLVRMPDPHTGELAYSTLDALQPGKDAGLDRVCRVLLEGEPPCPPPTEAERARTTADEDAFLGVRAGGAPPRVSVVVPCFNYGHFLADAVGSILAQTYTDLEVIVVDDGSTDDSLAVARALEEAHAQVRVVAQENAGQPAIARNNGIAIARGEYVLCLDADDELHPEFLERTVRVLDGDADVSIAYGDQQNIGAKTDFEPHPPYDARMLARFNFIPTACLFRRTAWEAVGGYRTNVRGYEDWDFWVACSARGHHGRHVPGALWLYRHHEGGLYAEQQGEDARLKAQVVLNNAELYTETQQSWARGILAGDPAALPLQTPLGVVPEFATAPAGHAPGAAPGTRLEEPLHVLMTMYGWAEEGGGTMLPRQVAKELVRRGHRVTVLATPPQRKPEKPPYWVEETRDEGVDVLYVYNRPAVFYDLEHPEREVEDREMRRLVERVLAERRPDVAHYHSLLNFSLAVPEAVKAAGVPSAYTAHNYWPICPRMYLYKPDLSLCGGPVKDGSNCGSCVGAPAKAPAFARRAERGREVVGRGVDLHLAPSARAREVFVANGHDADRIEVLHQAPQTVEPLWREVGSKREPAAALDRPLKVGFIGSLLAHKGTHVLVAAAQVFAAEEVEFHVFGAGPEPYERALGELDKAGRVVYHGRYDVERLPEILASVDVLAVPSTTEDIAPLVLAEARAARLPVIGSSIGGIPDFVEDGVDGFLVTPRDPAALAEAIRAFLEDPELLGRMQAAIGEPRSFGAYVDDLVDRYRRLAAASIERLEGARAFACLAFADELVEDPSLLAAYGQAFAAGDEATLVIYAPDGVTDALGDAVASAGLEDDEAADLLALASEGDHAAEVAVARRVDAVLSRRTLAGPFAGRPAFDETQLDELRALAQARWAA